MQDWLVWQLIDSAFPSGGFAHSGGLEAAWQQGVVSNADELTEYLHVSQTQIAQGVLTFVRQAGLRLDRFNEIDADCDLFLNNHIANRASRAQGKALLASAASSFQNDAIKTLAAAVREQRLPSHLAPVFGYVTKSLDLDEECSMNMFLFIAMRSSLSSAVRLGIVGPLEAQSIQSKIKNRNSKIENPAQVAPILDLIQAGQDRLYSRLFQS